MLRDLTDIKGLLVTNPVVNIDGLEDFKLPYLFKAKLKDLLSSRGYYFNDYTSYAVTDKESQEKPANFAVIPNQYFVYACHMYELAIELYKYFEIFEKLKSRASELVGNAENIQEVIESDGKLRSIFNSKGDISLFSKFLDKNDPSFRLGSKRLINDQGKPRGSKDCFGSVILKEINIPDVSSAIFGKLVYDLVEIPEVYLDLKNHWERVTSKNFNDNHQLLNVSSELSVTILPKPFLLLAGISGTGKTRFVREQARETDSTLNNYCLVPVRPDWHEPSDLLGYITRLSGHAEYVTTDVLTFIVKAWQVAAPNADKEGMGDINEQSIPYWLCLDEMNLAPVEQYFADYLSVLESRKFDENGYQCEALLNANMLQGLIETDTKLPNNLGLSSNDGLWHYFLQHGISLPPNLIVAGTVNMDETTHGFSRKVIDRAITLDFGEFFPNVYADYFDKKIEPVVFTWSPLTHCLKEDLASTEDAGGTKSIAFLESVNSVLKRTPFELAYRALNELLLQVACLNPKNDNELQAIWDDFLMTKVLPRIDGDEDKLRLLTDGGEGTLLDGLMTVLEANLPLVWNDGRKDFFRMNIDGTNTSDILCRSKAKLEWMKDRLAINTFTSYWP